MANDYEFSVGDRVRFRPGKDQVYAEHWGLPVEFTISHVDEYRECCTPEGYAGQLSAFFFRLEKINEGPW